MRMGLEGPRNSASSSRLVSWIRAVGKALGPREG